MNEADAIYALAWHFNWNAQLIFPNVHVAGGEMDLCIITRSSYLVEIEIKLTAGDWRKDQKKTKWNAAERQHVSRFYYAIADGLQDNIPEFVPVSAGILILFPQGDRLYVREHRPAHRARTPKLPDQLREQLLESAYYRFWRERLHRYRRRVA